MTLLLTEGDRTCEECNGTGKAMDEHETEQGDRFDIEVDCEHCEGGRTTERQNRKRIDMAFRNWLERELILHERFVAAVKRRGCEGRGVRRDRFVIYFCGIHESQTMLPTGPTIQLPDTPIGTRAAIAYLEWRNARPLAA